MLWEELIRITKRSLFIRSIRDSIKNGKFNMFESTYIKNYSTFINSYFIILWYVKTIIIKNNLFLNKALINSKIVV